MIVVMKSHATEAEIENVVRAVEALAYHAHVIRGVERTVVACVGEERGEGHSLAHLESVGGVERVMPVLRSFKLASREVRPEGSRIDVGGVTIGGPQAGSNCRTLRGREPGAGRGAPHGGQSWRRPSAARRCLQAADLALFVSRDGERRADACSKRPAARVSLPVVTEIMDAHDIEEVAEHADMLQVGARNAQNFSLLRRLGKIHKPILLKRGMSTRLEEFVMAAEYILSEGNPNVVLCERGIRTFETATRNTLDLNAVPLLKEWTHLPVLVDPSHGTGIWSLVAPMAMASIAAGADGLLIEVHPDPAARVVRWTATAQAAPLCRTDGGVEAARGGRRAAAS